MNYIKKIIAGSLAATLVSLSSLSAGLANANPACFQYNPNGFTTSTTPVFNNICGDTTQINSTSGPYTFGDEPNFVRIRPDTSGDDTSNRNNPPLVDQVTSTCDNGNKFDVWTYIHNDASQDFNANGTGSAVAHNVQLALSAPGVGSTGTSFSFASTITASNAPTVSDNAGLTCNGQPVKLTLVPGSVHYTLNVANPSYSDLADSAVNGTTKLGNPTFGSGDQWGCYNFRIVVVYQVTVSPVTTPTPTPHTPTPTPPTTLVNTGAGSMAGLFIGATLAGAAAYRWALGRRLNRQ